MYDDGFGKQPREAVLSQSAMATNGLSPARVPPWLSKPSTDAVDLSSYLYIKVIHALIHTFPK